MCNVILHTIFRDLTVNKESLEGLAKKYGVVTGKWMFFIRWSDADEALEKLVKGMKDGKFPKDLGVLFIRFFGRKDRPEGIAGTIFRDDAFISIFTKNWTDKEATLKIGGIIRSLGISQKLTYKPDIYSKLEIRNGNVFSVHQTTYEYQEHEH